MTLVCSKSAFFPEIRPSVVVRQATFHSVKCRDIPCGCPEDLPYEV